MPRCPLCGARVATDRLMVMHMADLSSKAIKGMVRDTPTYNPTIPIKLPAFLEQFA